MINNRANLCPVKYILDPTPSHPGGLSCFLFKGSDSIVVFFINLLLFALGVGVCVGSMLSCMFLRVLEFINHHAEKRASLYLWCVLCLFIIVP